MSQSFSGSEIIQMALHLEEYGYQYYMSAAQETSQSELCNLFTRLAQEEEKHKGIIRQIAEELNVVASQYEDEDAYLYLDWLVQGRVFPSSVDDELPSDTKQLLLGAIDREKDTLLFYYGLKEVVKEQAMEAVERLIAEEKRHVVQLTHQLREVETQN